MKLNPTKNEIQLPHKADRPNLAALQLSRAGPYLPQFWSDLSEILNLWSKSIEYSLRLHASMKLRVAKHPNGDTINLKMVILATILGSKYLLQKNRGGKK